MRYRYYTVDVFTHTQFGGNPLAVFPDAEGLTTEKMQALAREFNYSESTFVLPSKEPSSDAKVRIFMPAQEVPFAGHPNVGTAFALAATGAFGTLEDGEHTVSFEELGGVVPVRILIEDSMPVFCELTAPQALQLGPELPRAGLAKVLGLCDEDLRGGAAIPIVASVGLPIAMVELVSAEALGKASVSAEDWAAYTSACGGVLVFVRDTDAKVRCRMFAPLLGIPEDPATGSAVCALAGVLGKQDGVEGVMTYDVRQGIEMGRPSFLTARVLMEDGVPSALFVGGPSVLVMEGTVDV